MHAVEASYVTASPLSAFRAAVVGAFASTPVILNLFDGRLEWTLPFTVWTRFRQMRKFLAFRPQEIPRVEDA